jgi:hypothetical protein
MIEGEDPMQPGRSALTALAGITTAAFLAACGGGGGGGSGGTGTLSVALTDSPACGFDHVYVTVERVRIHASGDADDTTRSGWTDIVLRDPVTDRPTPRKIDLLRLVNGEREPLGLTEIPAGNYTQLRLVLAPNRGNNLANSIVPTGGTEVELDTPSATQSGIKVIRPFSVAAGRQVDLVLDFDACRSIVQRGNSSYGLKPVVTGHLVDVAVIAGTVTGPAGVTVSVQKDGEVVRSTVPAANGSFRVPFLDASRAPYDVVFSAADRSIAVVTGVPAAVGSLTSLGTIAMPASLAAVPSRAASGLVNPVAARDIGEVRALQAIGPTPAGGTAPFVEVRFRNVNALDGSYSLTLPTEAPRVGTFGPAITLLPFAASAGGYTLQARAIGFAVRNADVDLRSTDATGVNFELPPVP